MPFRVRTIGEEGRFGPFVTIAGYDLTGEPQVFLGEHDEDLGFGVPPVELVEAAGVGLETLGGQPWPGSHLDRNGRGAGKNAMLHAFRDGEWPDEAELVLQANVTAKHDPKTRAAVLKQHFLRQGLTEEQAERETERRVRPGRDSELLDGVEPIKPRKRPARALPAASRQGSEPPDQGDAPDGDAPDGELTPAAAQARREASGKASGKGSRATKRS